MPQSGSDVIIFVTWIKGIARLVQLLGF